MERRLKHCARCPAAGTRAHYCGGGCQRADKCLICGLELVTFHNLESGDVAKSQMTFGQSHQMPTEYGYYEIIIYNTLYRLGTRRRVTAGSAPPRRAGRTRLPDPRSESGTSRAARAATPPRRAYMP